MFEYIGTIINENGQAVLVDYLDKTHFLGCKFKILMRIFKYYDENFRLNRLWCRDRYVVSCNEPKSVCNVFLELPTVSKKIQKEVYSRNGNIEIKGKIFDGQVERFLYERLRYIFSRKKSD